MVVHMDKKWVNKHMEDNEVISYIFYGCLIINIAGYVLNSCLDLEADLLLCLCLLCFVDEPFL